MNIKLLALLAGFTAFSATSAVQLTINNKPYQYDNNPRLAEVLQPVALEQHWYWPAAALYRLDSDKPEQLRQSVLQQLAQIKQQHAENAELSAALRHLSHFIHSWQLAERIPVQIDYDLARSQLKYNPRLDDGNYLLLLVKRPAKVSFWGAVAQAGSLTHMGKTDTAGYLAGQPLSEQADKEKVYLLQANGDIHSVNVAYFNKQHIEVMPGGQIFVPFATNWFNDEFEQLNQQLLLLAKYRVLQ